jgi:hypothetical protein
VEASALALGERTLPVAAQRPVGCGWQRAGESGMQASMQAEKSIHVNAWRCELVTRGGR